ncbi:MAG: conserved phage C-terminal domain-containing protein, partial [bacterium]|nr:conserved phage C-terminal domain-containing protein [bacterium]
LVADRLRQGFTEEELIAVIDLKASQWLGGEFAKYLRPATLFNKTKFEQYVGEIGAKNSIEIRAAAAKAAEDKRKAEEKPITDEKPFKGIAQMILDGDVKESEFTRQYMQNQRRLDRAKASHEGS